MSGDATARHNLGYAEGAKGDYDKALEHLLISVGSGLHDSLDTIKPMYRLGKATKEDYAKVLRLGVMQGKISLLSYLNDHNSLGNGGEGKSNLVVDIVGCTDCLTQQ